MLPVLQRPKLIPAPSTKGSGSPSVAKKSHSVLFYINVILSINIAFGVLAGAMAAAQVTLFGEWNAYFIKMVAVAGMGIGTTLCLAAVGYNAYRHHRGSQNNPKKIEIK